jgi:hypothetical protein
MSSVLSIFSGAAPAVLGTLTGVLVSAFVVFVDYAKDQWRKRFRHQIKLALARESLSFTDLQHIAERWGQDRKQVLQSLRVLLAEGLSGEDKDLIPRVDSIRSLLAQHEAREPYAELPENISLQLASLAKQESTDVSQLASSLSDLYSKNQREATRQKKLSFWGFVVGVIGLLLSVPGLYIAFKS